MLDCFFFFMLIRSARPTSNGCVCVCVLARASSICARLGSLPIRPTAEMRIPPSPLSLFVRVRSFAPSLTYQFTTIRMAGPMIALRPARKIRTELAHYIAYPHCLWPAHSCRAVGLPSSRFPAAPESSGSRGKGIAHNCLSPAPA